jgi:hypothetical protein
MAKNPNISKPISTALAAASAASIPLGVAAAQTAEPPSTGTTTFSFEGGVAFSNYWQTTYPGNPANLLPGVPSSADKTGAAPVSSAPLQSPHNDGGYGSFSVSRDIDSMIDWRFSAAFYDFGATSSSASASQAYSGRDASFTNTAAITETDRFSFETFDFDFGRKGMLGPIQFRAFAGLRGLHTDDTFATDTATVGTDKVGSYPLDTYETVNTGTYAVGTSEFVGIGPRVGFDFNTVGTWSLVGSVSAAWIGGQRQSDYESTTTTSINGGTPTITATGTYSDRYTSVSNLEGMVGVAWQFSSYGQVLVGDKFDAWYDIRDSFAFAGYGNKQDLQTQTPFLRVTIRY